MSVLLLLTPVPLHPPLFLLSPPTPLNLQALANSGRTVVVCIHQPRSGITALFDSLVLLSEGRSMYSGLAVGAVPLFEACGYPCPVHTNPADHWLDVISPASGTPAAAASSRARIDALAAAYAAAGDGALAAQRAANAALPLPPCAAPGDAEAGGGSAAPAAGAKGGAAAPAHRRSPGPGRFLVELGALVHRATRLAVRSRLENAITVVRSLIFALLLGLIWLRVGRDVTTPAQVRNVGGLLFFSLINVSFSSVFGIIFVFVDESAHTHDLHRLHACGAGLCRFALTCAHHARQSTWWAESAPPAATTWARASVGALVPLCAYSPGVAAAVTLRGFVACLLTSPPPDLPPSPSPLALLPFSSYFISRLVVQLPRTLTAILLHCVPVCARRCVALLRRPSYPAPPHPAPSLAADWLVALRPDARAFFGFVVFNLLVALNTEARGDRVCSNLLGRQCRTLNSSSLYQLALRR